MATKADKDLQKENDRLRDIITICHRENDRLRTELAEVNKAMSLITVIAKKY